MLLFFQTKTLQFLFKNQSLVQIHNRNLYATTYYSSGTVKFKDNINYSYIIFFKKIVKKVMCFHTLLTKLSLFVSLDPKGNAYKKNIDLVIRKLF